MEMLGLWSDTVSSPNLETYLSCLRGLTPIVGCCSDNSRPNVDVAQRLESPILGLKRFNNWVKSVLITRFAHPALAVSRTVPGKSGKVLDMGCGKGGDLPKWAKARVKELIGVGACDICCSLMFLIIRTC
jgi:hypothetical protein